MKRTLILLVIFAVLGLGTVQYLRSGSVATGNSVAEGKFELLFAVENVKQVHKIFLADRKGNQTTLERRGNGNDWTLNGEYLARPSAMELLLDVIENVRVKYRPAEAAKSFMVDNLSSVGTKVELYDKKGEKIKCYYVGGSSHDEAGTFMILENSNEPLVAHIPRFVGNLQNRYGLVGAEWRDKSVFRDKLEDIQSVSIDYPDPDYLQHSFTLNRLGRNRYEVKPNAATTPVIDREVKLGQVEAFLVKFESRIAEAIENKNPEREQILQQIPFCTLTLTRTDGTVKKVRFIPIFPDDDPVYDKEGEVQPVTRKVFRYYADYNEKDFFLVQHRVMGELFWSYDAFF
ncbi:MAG: hypothetical protein AAFW73_05550 [Bacteroidota bacterium]